MIYSKLKWVVDFFHSLRSATAKASEEKQTFVVNENKSPKIIYSSDIIL